MRWDKELPFIISEQTGYEEVYIQEVIKSCLVIGLFSNELFEKEKIITSKGIQERYQYICNLSKRKCNNIRVYPYFFRRKAYFFRGNTRFFRGNA